MVSPFIFVWLTSWNVLLTLQMCVITEKYWSVFLIIIWTFFKQSTLWFNIPSHNIVCTWDTYLHSTRRFISTEDRLAAKKSICSDYIVVSSRNFKIRTWCGRSLKCWPCWLNVDIDALKEKQIGLLFVVRSQTPCFCLKIQCFWDWATAIYICKPICVLCF